MGDNSYYGGGGGGQQKKAGGLDQGKIFVGGLSWQTTEESLRWHFEQYGPVVSVEVMRDRVTGDPRGFAFVVFREPSTVDLVMNESKHEINHKIVDVKRAQARGVAPPSIHDGGASKQQQQHLQGGGGGGDPRHSKSNYHHNNNNNNGEDGGSGGLTPEQLHNKVFVGGLPAHVDRDELRKIFEKYGAVTDSIVMIDQVTNRSRCFGFVTFENGSNGAQRAIDAQPIQIGQRSVEVKLATPKAEQKRMPPTSAGPKHVGLRAGMSSSSSSGEYAGLAVAFGRSGWKAGYGSKAFGAAGWAVEGWDDGGYAPPKDGFSFDMLLQPPPTTRKSSNSGAGGGGGGGRKHHSHKRGRDHRDRSKDGHGSKRPRHQ